MPWFWDCKKGAASNLLAMASNRPFFLFFVSNSNGLKPDNLLAIASNLKANYIRPFFLFFVSNSNGLQPDSDGLQPNSKPY